MRRLLYVVAIIVGTLALLYFVQPEPVSDEGATQQTVQIIDTRTHVPLEDVGVSAQAYDTRPRCEGCVRPPLRTWELKTDRDGRFTVLMPRYGTLEIKQLRKDGYTTNWNQTVDEERLRYEADLRDNVRYLTPTVDVNYEYIRYLYFQAARVGIYRDINFHRTLGYNMGYAYRRASDAAKTDRERGVLLAFCRHANAMKAEVAAGWPTAGTQDAAHADVQSIIDDCAMFVHPPAGAAFAGYLADADGVAPIPGAVVSVDWEMEPYVPVASDKAQPTRLATWQVRTGPDGYFEIRPPADALESSADSHVLRARPKLRVYALGRDRLEVVTPPFEVAVHGTQVTVTKWPPQDEVITLSPPRLAPNELAEQVNSWYGDAHHAIVEQRWAGGARQALESYKPLLDLLAEGCALLATNGSVTPDGCQKAKAEFGLEVPTAFLAKLDLQPSLIRTSDLPREPILITSGPEPSVQSVTTPSPKD